MTRRFRPAPSPPPIPRSTARSQRKQPLWKPARRCAATCPIVLSSSPLSLLQPVFATAQRPLVFARRGTRDRPHAALAEDLALGGPGARRRPCTSSSGDGGRLAAFRARFNW